MTEATQPGSPDKLYGAAKKRLAAFEALLEDMIATAAFALEGVAAIVRNRPSSELAMENGAEKVWALHARLVELAENPEAGYPSLVALREVKTERVKLERVKTERKSMGALVYLTKRQTEDGPKMS